MLQALHAVCAHALSAVDGQIPSLSCLSETEIVDMLLEHHPLQKADMEINATLVFALSGLLDGHSSKPRPSLPLRLFGVEFLLLVGAAHTTISFAATFLRRLTFGCSFCLSHRFLYPCTIWWLASLLPLYLFSCVNLWHERVDTSVTLSEELGVPWALFAYSAPEPRFESQR